MKKVVFFLILLFSSIGLVNAQEKVIAQFGSCVDGDTAKFILNDEEITVRFLAIDTPETKHPSKGEQAWGKEASNYTCNMLKSANMIELEYDDGSEKLDKYNRHLVWIWVDGILLQDEIIKKGYAEVAYLYGDYKYTNMLNVSQLEAKANKLGIWSNGMSYAQIGVLIVLGFLGLLIILSLVTNLFSKKDKRKFVSLFKKYSKKVIK